MPTGPFDILHGVADPSVLTPIATVAEGPWDAAPGLLDDGALHFFRLRGGGPEDPTIAVTSALSRRTVRLSWRHARLTPAAPDPTLSTATVDGDCLGVGGGAAARLVVTPKDAAGDRLGSGLDVRPASPEAWWPGVATGGFADLGDGRYAIEVAAAVPGVATLPVIVEGVTLAAAPVVNFSSGAPSAAMSATPPIPGPGDVVELTAAVVGGMPPLELTWDVDGDGHVDGTGPTYRMPPLEDLGVRAVVLHVVDAAGCRTRAAARIHPRSN